MYHAAVRRPVTDQSKTTELAINQLMRLRKWLQFVRTRLDCGGLSTLLEDPFGTGTGSLGYSSEVNRGSIVEQPVSLSHGSGRSSQSDRKSPIQKCIPQCRQLRFNCRRGGSAGKRWTPVGNFSKVSSADIIVRKNWGRVDPDLNSSRLDFETGQILANNEAAQAARHDGRMRCRFVLMKLILSAAIAVIFIFDSALFWSEHACGYD